MSVSPQVFFMLAQSYNEALEQLGASSSLAGHGRLFRDRVHDDIPMMLIDEATAL